MMTLIMKNVIITVSENYLDKITSVSELLRENGLNIKHVFEFGVITGEVDEMNIQKLTTHREIFTMTEDKQANIPSPDSEIQ